MIYENCLLNNSNIGKLVVIIVTGFVQRANGNKQRKFLLRLFKPFIKPKLPATSVVKSIEREMKVERMKVVGSIQVKGNVPCLTYRKGNVGEMSRGVIIFGKGTTHSPNLCDNVEDQTNTWNELQVLGKKLRDILI